MRNVSSNSAFCVIPDRRRVKAVSMPTDPVLNRILEKVIDVARPDRVILFGSRSNGKARLDSDYDLLVVYSGSASCRQVAMNIHRRLIGIPVAVDVHVVPPQILAQYADSPALIYRDILRKGQELYAA